jgi:anti-sigma28 factor (negative regulator of flagellin synthesis)
LKNKKITPPADIPSKPATRTPTAKQSESKLAKIKAVKRAINDGSFKVNADIVADKLIETSRNNLRQYIKKISH